MTTVSNYQPIIDIDCEIVTFSHPAFTGGFGEPNGYILYINGEPQAYTPGSIVIVAEGTDDWQVTLKATYSNQSFEHQLGQSKGGVEACEPEPTQEPTPEPTTDPIPTEEPTPTETTPVLTPDPTDPGDSETIVPDEPVESEVAIPTESTPAETSYSVVQADEPVELATTGGEVVSVMMAAVLLCGVGTAAVVWHVRKERK